MRPITGEAVSSVSEFFTAEPQTAVLDDAHIGHINGALGTIRHGAAVLHRDKFADGGNRCLPHWPHSAAARRPGDFGSFSAMPSLSARRRISVHTSSGVMPHSYQSTTSW